MSSAARWLRVRLHDALRGAGGARGVHDRRDVARLDGVQARPRAPRRMRLAAQRPEALPVEHAKTRAARPARARSLRSGRRVSRLGISAAAAERLPRAAARPRRRASAPPSPGRCRRGSRADSVGYTGIVTPPVERIAKSARTHSARVCERRPTASPGWRPSAIRPSATSRTSSPSARHDTSRQALSALTRCAGLAPRSGRPCPRTAVPGTLASWRASLPRVTCRSLPCKSSVLRQLICLTADARRDGRSRPVTRRSDFRLTHA